MGQRWTSQQGCFVSRIPAPGKTRCSYLGHAVAKPGKIVNAEAYVPKSNYVTPSTFTKNVISGSIFHAILRFSTPHGHSVKSIISSRSTRARILFVLLLLSRWHPTDLTPMPHWWAARTSLRYASTGKGPQQQPTTRRLIRWP